MMNKILIDTGKKSIKREVTLDAYVYKFLKNMAEEGNKTKTKGTLSYELLQFDNPSYDDALVRLEINIDKELDNEGIDAEWFDGIADSNVNVDSFMYTFLAEQESPYEKYENINIQILEEFDDSLDWSRGWSQRLSDAIRTVVSSGFSSRMDRIEAKQDLLNNVRMGEEPEHKVIAGLLYDSDDYHYPKSLVKKVKSDMPVWELVDTFDFDTMVDECSDMTQWDERFEAIYSAYSDESEEEVAKFVRETWGIGQKYAEDKVSEFASEYDIDFNDDVEDEEEDEEFRNFQEIHKKLMFEVIRNDYSDEAEKLLGQLIQTKIENALSDNLKMYRFAAILEKAKLIENQTKKQYNKEPKKWFVENTTEKSAWKIDKHNNLVELD